VNLLQVLVVHGVEDSAVDRERAEAVRVLAHVQFAQQRTHLVDRERGKLSCDGHDRSRNHLLL